MNPLAGVSSAWARADASGGPSGSPVADRPLLFDRWARSGLRAPGKITPLMTNAPIRTTALRGQNPDLCLRTGNLNGLPLEKTNQRQSIESEGLKGGIPFGNPLSKSTKSAQRRAEVATKAPNPGFRLHTPCLSGFPLTSTNTGLTH